MIWWQWGWGWSQKAQISVLPVLCLFSSPDRMEAKPTVSSNWRYSQLLWSLSAHRYCHRFMAFELNFHNLPHFAHWGDNLCAERQFFANIKTTRFAQKPWFNTIKRGAVCSSWFSAINKKENQINQRRNEAGNQLLLSLTTFSSSFELHRIKASFASHSTAGQLTFFSFNIWNKILDLCFKVIEIFVIHIWISVMIYFPSKN